MLPFLMLRLEQTLPRRAFRPFPPLRLVLRTFSPLTLPVPSAAARSLTPLESALPQNAPITRLESALPKTQDLKPFRIRTYEKTPGGGGKLLTRNHSKDFRPACPVYPEPRRVLSRRERPRVVRDLPPVANHESPVASSPRCGKCGRAQIRLSQNAKLDKLREGGKQSQ